MSREYRLYRQDVIHDFGDGRFLHDDDHIEGDSPTTDAEVTLVELDGTEISVVLLGYHPLFKLSGQAPE